MAGLKVEQRGGIYYATGTIAGQRVRKSLGTRDSAQAEELRAHYEAKLWKRHSYGEQSVRTFEEAALSYQQAEGERRFLAPIIKQFKGRVLGTIAPEEIRQFARKLYPNKSKGATRNRMVLVPARAVINHAAGLNWCAPIKIESFKADNARRRSVSRDWLDTFLLQADKDKLPHLAAAMMFMWQNGPRISEVSRVLPDHVDLAARLIWLEDTKTSKWEPCHVTTELIVRLANLRMVNGMPVFGYQSRFGISRRMKAVCRRAGLEFVPPHQSGRHSFATNALAMGASLREVMEGGRWKSARLVLETYAHAEHGGRAIADRFDASLTQQSRSVAQVSERKAG